MGVVHKEEMGDTTLLIQGPLKEDTYRFYCSFYPEIPKVFSTWEGNGASNGWRPGPKLHSDGDFFIENKFPNRLGSLERRMELDVVATLVGLKRVRTKFVIRLRGDEWYSNLCLVSRAVEEDPKKRIHMAPIFLKKWEAWPFGMSDHILAGRTEDLALMFETCLSNIVTEEEIHPECWPLPSQCILAKGYFGKKMPDSKDPKEDFKRLFRTIDLDRLKFYKVSSHNGRESWYSNFKPSIKGMAEI
jgi:hypothetical protein